MSEKKKIKCRKCKSKVEIKKNDIVYTCNNCKKVFIVKGKRKKAIETIKDFKWMYIKKGEVLPK